VYGEFTLYNEDMYANTETGIRVGWGWSWAGSGGVSPSFLNHGYRGLFPEK
jgi:hypothetical protein